MRRLILAAALVGVALPAMAQDREASAERRAARAEQRQQKPRAGQSEHALPDRPRVEPTRVEQQPPPQVERPRMEWHRQAPVEQPRVEQPRAEQPRLEQQVPQRGGRLQNDWRQPHQGADEQQRNGQRDGQQWNGRREKPQWTGRPREVQPQPGGQQWTGRRYQAPQPGGQQWTGQHRDDQHRDSQRWAGSPDEHRWSSNWQHDPRYDWRRYRDQNRSIFRIGSYYDPFGWSYRRVNVGFTLYSGYYSPNYWLDDPWQYRLPPVYGPYRWVRYYDDAVLVDLYSGRVVEVIRNFFW